MSKFILIPIHILLLSYLTKIKCLVRICPEEAPHIPKSIDNVKSYTLSSITVNETQFHPIIVGNQIFLQENVLLNTSLFNTKEILFKCPDGYRVPTYDDYAALIANLSTKAYSTFTDGSTSDSFNLSAGIYAITSTKSNNDTNSYNYYSLFCNSSTSECGLIGTDLVLTGGKVIKCIINTLSPKIYMVDKTKKVPYIGESRTFAIDNSTLLGILWQINARDTFDNVNTVTMKYEEYGMNRIESWSLNFINEVVYSCIQIFVESKNNYTLNELNMETDLITVDTKIPIPYYQPNLHYNTSNVVVAPRYHGNYYIGFKNITDNFIHVLSYSKDNVLKNNYNTLHRGDLIDMIASPIGCTLYIKNLDKTSGTTAITYNSHLLVYNSNFTLLAKLNIMNNNEANKAYKAKALQIHQFDSQGNIKNGMEYMYNPVNSRLHYGHGRVCLLFSYTNYFNSSVGSLNGDTFVTFDEHLNYSDYGKVFGTSNSLIQDFTETENYFVTASLSGTLQGINVVFTSKYDKTNYYDGKASSNNQRVTYSKSDIAGKISGNENGESKGKLGGIFYFSNDNSFVLVYSNTNDDVSKRHGIYMTSFNFNEEDEENRFYNIKKTTILELSSNQDLYQIRAGQLGDNVIILYSLSEGAASSFPGILPQKSTTLYAIVNKNGTIKKTGGNLGESQMPSNEAMKNFHDGRLLWASISPDNTIVVHKLGTLNNYDDAIDDDDLEIYTIEDYIEDDDEKISKLHWIIIGCILGFVFIVLVIILVIFCYKNCYLKTGEQKTYIGENPDEQYDKDADKDPNADSNNGLDINAVNEAEDDKGNGKKKKHKKKHKKDKGYDF
jgi:hypothetical protein